MRTTETRSVRPTTDMVKGAIFSMLESEAYKRGLAEPGYLAGAENGEQVFPWRRVLDLYSGSGALGIECLSRGAGWVDFVESDARARAVIKDNLKRTGLEERAGVHGMRVEAAVSTFNRAYDLILLDPPYSASESESVFRQLCASALVSDSTFVVLEHSRGKDPPAACGPLALLKTRYHGGTGISVYAPTVQE